MKHLLNGVAIAAALAIAAPAWAQAPAAPATPSAAAPMAPMAPMAGKQRHKRVMHRRMARRAAPAESTTDQLNREELARIQGGGGASASPPLSSASPYGKGGTPK